MPGSREGTLPYGGRFEAGDVLAFLYALVLIRQAFWIVPENLAWVLSVGAAALMGALRVRSRRLRPRLPAAFWWGTAAPLGAFWALHVSFPDIGFDTLNYHILHGERALRGLIAIPGDFYPYYFPFLNPAPDILTALLRTLVGYRLGTIGSFLVLVWTGAVLFRALERPIPSKGLRAVATLWIVCSEGILWEVGNYMVDLFALPLLLEAALLVLPEEDGADGTPRDLLEDLPLLGALLGSAVAFKLTNLVFVAAIGLVLFGRLLVSTPPPRKPGRAAFSCGMAALAFFLPMAPHTLLLWWTTGSPLFPHFNSLFRSTLFPPFNLGDGRFGPTSRLEALVWPVVSVFHPARLSEMGATSGRLALGFLGAVAALFARRDSRLRGLGAVVILGSILWSLGTGNHRYGLFAELAGGLVLVLLSARLFAAAAGRGRAAQGAAWIPVALLFAQSVLVFGNVAAGDWSGRPTAFYDPRAAWNELGHLGTDRDLRRGLPAGLRDALDSSAGWVDAAPKTNGFMALLAPRLPMIGLGISQFFDHPANLARFNRALSVSGGRPLLSLALVQDLELAKTALARRGFGIRRETPYAFPFYSSLSVFDVVALELEVPAPAVVPPLEDPVSSPGGLLRRPERPKGGREDVDLLGSLDAPLEGAEIRGTLVVTGWARIPGQDLEVKVLFDGVERTPDEFRRTARPDVEAVVPILGSCATAGYEARLRTQPSDAGGHELAVVFRSPDGRERHYPGRRVVLVPGP